MTTFQLRERLIRYYCELPSVTRKPLWRFWHKVIHKLDSSQVHTFLNYGYHNPDEFSDFYLAPEDEPNKYSIQLYNRVTQSLSFASADILEVGCGRGGGAAWLAKTFSPKSYIAVDISRKAIDFGNATFKIPSLSFKQGDATNLPFEDNSFDALINIESARCYSNIDQFFKEVKRVLKPDGRFYFADMIKVGETDNIKKLLMQNNFKIIEQNNLTKGICLALEKESDKKKHFIDKAVPGFLRSAFYEFAGVKGSNRFEVFNSGEMEYWHFILEVG